MNAADIELVAKILGTCGLYCVLVVGVNAAETELVGMILGICGGIVLLILLGVLICFLCRR